MAKWMASFLALWLLALSGLPCRDAVAAVPTAQATVQAAHPSHDKGCCGDAADACSPLCACACCAVGVVIPPAPALPVAAVPAAEKPAFLPHPSGTPAGTARTVWQPPRAV